MQKPDVMRERAAVDALRGRKAARPRPKPVAGLEKPQPAAQPGPRQKPLVR